MKSLLLLLSVFLIAAPSISQKKPEDLDLPELHKIKKGNSFTQLQLSIQGRFPKGLCWYCFFLSKSSRDPDLLFNGNCSQDYLEGSTAGDEMTVMADLGKLKLEDLRTAQAFNVQGVHSPELYSKFTRVAEIQIGHTYAVLIDKPDERGLFYFTIDGYIPNERWICILCQGVSIAECAR